MRTFLLSALILGLAFPAFAGEPTNEMKLATTTKIIDPEDRDNPPPIQPANVRTELAAEAPEDFPALPEESTVHGAGKVGLLGKEFAFAVLAGEEEGSFRFAIDQDGDGTFAETEYMDAEGQSGPRGSMARVMDVDLKVGSATHKTAFLAQTRGGPWTGVVFGLWYASAEVSAGEKTYEVVLFDGDLDGSYGGSEDRWIVREAGVQSRPASGHGLMPFGEGTYTAGQRFVVKGVSGQAATLSMTPADGPDPHDLEMQRERVEKSWFERFAAEREGFIEAKGIDTSRPKAEGKINWRWVDFDTAKKMAADEGKPLFVDLMAFWCVWCYRLDFYTYDDAELVKFMNDNYVAVKLIQEQSSPEAFRAVQAEMESGGLPSMGIWNPAGELVHKIVGFKSPVEFVEELKTGHKAAMDPEEEDVEDEDEDEDDGMGDGGR